MRATWRGWAENSSAPFGIFHLSLPLNPHNLIVFIYLFIFVFLYFFFEKEEEKIQFYVKDFLSSQTELLIGVLTTGFDSIF
jgi:hypothetical protein